ncbi:hypothetical protein PIB30_098530 [Stylosanthes scabra]|uniref:Uncharacterized protein n=1 Tax=Stylosanthes scabra TaxID=79078 RepID=A0ABU6XVP1_9FABA|nr:hypothetical protein [Stylosanthes scabra]
MNLCGGVEILPRQRGPRQGTGRRGRPKKRTGIPLDLGEPAAGTSAPTPVPVVPTPSLAEGGPTIQMTLHPDRVGFTPHQILQGPDHRGRALPRRLVIMMMMGHPQAPQIRCRGHRLTLLCKRGRGRISPWRRSSPGRLVISSSAGTVVTGSLCPNSVWPVMRWSVFGGTVGGLSFAYSAGMRAGSIPLGGYSTGMRAGSIPLGGREPPRDSVTCFTRSETREHLTRGYEMTCGTSWSSFGGRRTSRSSRRSTSRIGRPRRVDHFIRRAPPCTRPLETGWYRVELGRTPTHSEVFARTHPRKEDQLWVDKRSADVNEAFLAELKRLHAERQALMEAGCPEPPPIDEGALWTRFVGGRKRGRIYGMGVVPCHQYLIARKPFPSYIKELFRQVDRIK